MLVYRCLVTLVGVVSGALLLGEAPTASKVAGGVVIVLGVHLAQRYPRGYPRNSPCSSRNALTASVSGTTYSESGPYSASFSKSLMKR